jgi:hypothetical protein
MKLKNIPVHSSRMFTWGGDNFTGHIGLVDASDFGSSRIAGQIYDDACDVGFIVHSERTGKDELFFHANSYRDTDGELRHDTFVNRPTKPMITIKIFND